MPQSSVWSYHISTAWTNNLDRPYASQKIMRFVDRALEYEYTENRWRYLRSLDKIDRGYEEFGTTSNIHLFGDEFAKTTPVRFWLMDGGREQNSIYEAKLTSTSEIEFNGGNSLTYSPTPSRNIVNTKRAPLTGNWVSQFSRDHVAYELAPDILGTNSFLIGGWFKIDSLHSIDHLFQYGITAGAEIRATFDTGDDFLLTVDDNVGPAIVTKIAGVNIRDLQWHYIGVLIDRTRNKGTIFITNGSYESQVVKEFDIPANLLTLANGMSSDDIVNIADVPSTELASRQRTDAINAQITQNQTAQTKKTARETANLSALKVRTKAIEDDFQTYTDTEIDAITSYRTLLKYYTRITTDRELIYSYLDAIKSEISPGTIILAKAKSRIELLSAIRAETVRF